MDLKTKDIVASFLSASLSLSSVNIETNLNPIFYDALHNNT